MAATVKSRTASKLLKILEERYGKKPKPPNWDIVDTLLFYTIYYVSGVTAARRALKAIREEYVDLNEFRVSSLSEIRGTLSRASCNEQVAYQLRGILRQIYIRENVVSLMSLKNLPPEQVKRFLSRFDHVPMHAIDYLLLIRWNYPVLPVDSHVARLTSRLGLVAAKSSPTQTQKSLSRNIKSNLYFDFYTLFLEHASKVCTAKARCDRCVLLKYCKRGKTLSGKKARR